MTVAVKNNDKILIVSRAALRKAGFKRGQELEFKVSGGIITILPRVPSADDEYTPKERRGIDARLDKADQDIKAGRVHGPYSTHKATERSALFDEASPNGALRPELQQGAKGNPAGLR